jgi:hypothetical protein
MRKQKIRTPVSGLGFCLRINPRVVDSSLRVPLGDTKGLYKLGQTVAATTLDTDISRLEVVLVVET